MIITFFGHSTFCERDKYREKVLVLLDKLVGNSEAEIYLGEYGAFDAFAYECCKTFKSSHPNVSLVFVTPYLTEEYQ